MEIAKTAERKTKMANELCLYCHEDFDGYIQMLPKEGVGNAYIHCSHFGGWAINFSGKYHTKAKIKINFCPMCGRKLRRGAEDGTKDR